ncbi:MAG TPA: aminotransferase class I/II-fold pyridoxal phosphate-dependent enzyme [Aggregatilineales bacterium]|nr:aminotransferase class I/II-fold pyridoxal phosphate-dependent enzyme [Aggregatilineales bacterium]
MRRFISQRVQRVPPSGIRYFFDIAATMDDVISLGIGEPDFTSPASIRAAGVRSLEAGKTAYTSNHGIFELREQISVYIKRLYGVEYDPATEVLITVGVSEGMYLAMTAIIDVGDEVIIPEPAYVSYAPEVVFADGCPVFIPTCAERGFQITPEEIEARITPSTKAIMVGYPNNPTGAVLSRESMAGIAYLAEKYDLAIISDEIYDRLVYDIDHTNFASLPDMRERSIILGGFSKSHAMTGWRLGWAVGPEAMIGAMAKIHQYTIMSAPTISQYGALQGLLDGDDDVLRMRDEYNRRRVLLYQGFNELGLSCVEPKGAFYAFPSIRTTGMDEFTFCEKLLEEEQVAVIPGTAFGPSGKGHIRACYATGYDQIEEALTRIERFLKRHN